METTRTSEAPRSATVEGTRGARRTAGGEGASASNGPQDAFSLLLASWDSDSDAAGVLAVDDAAETSLADGLLSQEALDAAGALGGTHSLPQTMTAGAQGALEAMMAAGGMLEGALVAQTAQIDRKMASVQGAAPADEIPASVLEGGGRPTVARWMGAAQRAAADASGAVAVATNALKGAVTDKKTAIDSTLAAGVAAQGGAGAANVRAAGVSLPPEMLRVAGGAEAALASPVLQAVVGALAELSAQSRQGGRTGEGASGSAPAASAPLEGAGGTFAETMAMAAEGAPTGADGAAMTGEAAAAEPVAFWVNQATQNAELTLDRDGQPVEVRVSLTGNEAHVTFRSDQAQTREALDASVAQLRDLLQREGLVLAGVTVGSSGAQGDGGRGASSGRQGVQHGRVTAAGGGGDDILRATPSGQGGTHTVDIFV